MLNLVPECTSGNIKNIFLSVSLIYFIALCLRYGTLQSKEVVSMIKITKRKVRCIAIYVHVKTTNCMTLMCTLYTWGKWHCMTQYDMVTCISWRYLLECINIEEKSENLKLDVSPWRFVAYNSPTLLWHMIKFENALTMRLLIWNNFISSDDLCQEICFRKRTHSMCFSVANKQMRPVYVKLCWSLEIFHWGIRCFFENEAKSVCDYANIQHVFLFLFDFVYPNSRFFSFSIFL